MIKDIRPGNKNNTGFLLLCTLLIFYTIMQWHQLHADIWNDEMYTLKHFVLVYFRQTVTDYHVPNNHVFFSITEKVFLKIFGQKDLLLLLDKPWIARLSGLLYSYVTIIYVYAFGKKYYSVPVALTAVVMLLFTVPFYNFALQIRGYSLSMMLAVMLIYYVVDYAMTERKKLLLFTSLLTALLLYTIPSNYFLVLPLLLFLAIAAFVAAFRDKEKGKNFLVKLLGNKWSISGYSILAGVLLSLLLYAPILHAVFFNSYVAAPKMFNKDSLIYTLPEVLSNMLSARVLFFIPFIAGLLFIRRFKTADRIIILLLLSLMIFPFIIGFVKGDSLPTRIFSYLAPLCVVFTMPFFNQLYLLLKKTWQAVLLFTLTTVYCVFCFNKVLAQIDEHLYHNLFVGDCDMGLYNNYFSMHFQPYKETKFFKDNYYHHNTILVLKDSEPHDMPYYLKHFHLKYYNADALDSLMQTNDTIFVITRFPYSIKDEVFSTHPGWKAHFIYKEFTYHNFALLYRQ